MTIPLPLCFTAAALFLALLLLVRYSIRRGHRRGAMAIASVAIVVMVAYGALHQTGTKLELYACGSSKSLVTIASAGCIFNKLDWGRKAPLSFVLPAEGKRLTPTEPSATIATA